ncbi:MAG: SGNH/GDSL hydrolase family protein [Planctomycetota bacterium]|jgi:lysophospholipase L1-like esterase
MKKQSATKKNMFRSAVWTALLIPFVFLPYRWLWFPCGLAGMMLVFPTKAKLSEVILRNDTLIIGSVLVLVLRTLLDPGWWLPWIMLFLLLIWIRSQKWWTTKIAIPAVFIVWVTSIFLLLRPNFWYLSNQLETKVASDIVLVCAGDSLTSGVKIGTDADTYVAHLRQQLGCQVINAGFANDRVSELLARLDKDVLSKKPNVVLLFIGGNDYLDGTPRRTFIERLENVVSRITTTGTKLVIVEVPSGIVWNNYAGIYRKAAQHHDAILVPESRLRWWYSIELLVRDRLKNPLTIDGIHLSPAGAKRVADWLKPYVIRACIQSSSD